MGFREDIMEITSYVPSKPARLVMISSPALITPSSGMINGKRSGRPKLCRRSKTINDKFTKINSTKTSIDVSCANCCSVPTRKTKSKGGDGRCGLTTDGRVLLRTLVIVEA